MDFGDDWACDLEDCPNEADGEYEDADDDYPPHPPEGWVTVVIRRADAQNVLLTFCSEAHLAAGLQAPLPSPVPTVVPTDNWMDNLVGGAFVLLFVTVLILGVATLGVLVWEAGGYVLERL